VLFGFIAAIFGLVLGSSFIIFSFDKLFALLLKWFPVSILIASVLHFIQFGFFTPIKIPALFKSHRMINRAYKSDMEININDLKAIYSSFSDFTLHNTLAAVFYSVISGMTLIGFTLLEYWHYRSINMTELMVLVKIILLATMVILIIYGISTYLLTETLTNRERAGVYNNLLKNGIKLGPRILIGIRVKFLFFGILLVLTLLTFAALMEKTRFYDEYKTEIILSYFALSIFTGFVLMQINTRTILKMLRDMRRVTTQIASGGRAAFDVLSLESEFASIEFGLMEMAWEIDEYRKNLESMVDIRTTELQKALTDLQGKDNQIQKQLDMASIIQRSILPGKVDDWHELKFTTRYIAMEKIGGDFYDVHYLKGDKLGIMIADVSGHGIPAALVTTMAKISFGNAGAKYDSPKQIFQEVNQNILNHVKTQDYMTCFMVSIDDEYNVIYSNASHQKGLLLRTNAEVEYLDTGGLFIGAIEEARDSYEEKSTKLGYGDRLLLYTDGIPEAVNPDREEYSIDRLEKVAVENKNLPLEEFSNTLIDDLQKHIGDAELQDDITLLVIELARDEAVDIVKKSKKLLNTHKYYEAIEILEDGLVKFPDNQKILYNLTKNYFRVNNYSKAIHYIERYINHDKMNKYAYYILGSCYYKMLDYDYAIEQFEKALELDSNFTNALFALGMTYKKTGDTTEAKKTFEKVVNLDSDNKMAIFELRQLSTAAAGEERVEQ
jgi:sigma-B regulation protein RsbU (phosphoserine phosphatase)